MIREELYKKGIQENLYKLFLSEDFGGRNESIVSGTELIKSLAYTDGDLGWSVAIGTGGNYFSAYMLSQTAERVFAPKNSLIAGSGASTGKAIKADGGWQISGHWKYCSGGKNATTFTFNAIREDNGSVLTFCVPAEKVKVHDVWNALGMRNTDTHDVSLTDVFVPDEDVFSLEKPVSINHPAQGMSFLLFAEMCFIGVVEGLHARLIDLAKNVIANLHESDMVLDEDRMQKLSDNIFNNEQAAKIRWNEIMDLGTQFWNEHLAGNATAETEMNLSKAIRLHNAKCREESNLLFGKLGMTALDMDNPINICYRDFLTASQHSVLRIKG
ncbi:hypothetical protein K6119_12780 [Paracrocinitomix mangrovi]|uniref:hypothetical protein n=1 Tax=Paracrocinitomix mangrovi TaxID=2862509 RepID=UPI001C8DE148|nr:hypothetical protein [Paracrocinitomix mangrovi]UKN00605.1 hypothetical protein K6119_12780 [Paracrocinitomix mangrovi]